MRIVTTLPQRDLRLVGDAARAAEAAGFDGVVTLENRHEPFLALGVAAAATERLSLATGVAIAFPRSPMVTASTSWDLQVASRGRFVLGLGPQVRAHNENRFSVPWTPPVPRLREYVKALRAIWRTWETGEKLRFEGAHYRFTLMTPNFVPESMHLPPVPVTLAAVGPHSLRLAGEVADGVRLHAFCTRRYLETMVMPRLAEGWQKSGRRRENFEIHGGGFIATGPDNKTVAEKVDWVRMRIGFYGSTPAYWPVLEAHGLGDLGRKLNALSKQGQWETMTREISDDVVRLFAAVGTHREIAGAIAERFAGSDSVSASATSESGSDLPPDVLQDIQRLKTDFTGFTTAW
ncbi:MAG: TIGR03617 family F420-dependent LLM class oxidoreductase [Alphaproteobacteria bacterium]|nr:TIGR03617 family F420-dependent LLM class oxidoreductase [Alphaproteobacteria bacterium]